MSYGGTTSTQGSGGRLDQPQTTASFYAPAPHSGAGEKGLYKSKQGKKNKTAFPYFIALVSPTSHVPAVQVEHKGHLRTEQTRVQLMMLTEPGQKVGQAWDTLRCPLACLSLPKKPSKPCFPLSSLPQASLPPRPCCLPQVRAVSQGDGRLSHGTAASCAVTAEGKQPQRGLGRHFNSATRSPQARANPWNRYRCNESPCSQCNQQSNRPVSIRCQAAQLTVNFCINQV